MQKVHPDPLRLFILKSRLGLNYRIHCVIDDNLTAIPYTLNGAPVFDVTRDDDGNCVLDLEVADISAKEPPYSIFSQSQQSPQIKDVSVQPPKQR